MESTLTTSLIHSWETPRRGALARALQVHRLRRIERRRVASWLRTNPPSLGRATGCRV